MLCRQLIETLRIDVEQGRHLIDEGPCPTRAGTVHALLRRRFEICDLRVFAAQFDDDVGLGIGRVDRLGFRDHLLDECCAQLRGQAKTTRTGDCDSKGMVVLTNFLQAGSYILQKFGDAFADIRMMPSVIAVERVRELVGLPQDHGFHGCGADIETDPQWSLLMVIGMHTMCSGVYHPNPFSTL